MQIAEVMISSTYPHLACHESVKFNPLFHQPQDSRTYILRLKMKSIHNISA